LRSIVPHSKQLPTNKATILHQAADYIRRLTQTNKELTEVNQRLQELYNQQAAEITEIRRILYVHYPAIATNVFSNPSQSTSSVGLGNLANLALGTSNTLPPPSTLVANSIVNSSILPLPNQLVIQNSLSNNPLPNTLPLPLRSMNPMSSATTLPAVAINMTPNNLIPPNTMSLLVRSISPSVNTIGDSSFCQTNGNYHLSVASIPVLQSSIDVLRSTSFTNISALPFNTLIKDSCLTNGISSVLSDIAKESATSFNADVLLSSDILPTQNNI